jgi:DNA invertase Pin-like site-specific DNA recombinase
MTPRQTGKRYGAYHRISRLNGRDLDSETTMSDKDAFERLDAWATIAGATIAERYLDTDVSGSKLERPELDRMLADLDAGVIQGIAVAQVDRLSRADVGDALTVIRRIVGDDKDHPRPLVLLDLGIDPSTEFGEFGLTILLGLARMQWRRYQRTWSTAQKRAVKRGVWIGPAPFGYRATEVLNPKTGKPENGPLEEDVEGAGPIVREAFRVAAGDGLHAAMAYLEEHAPEKRWRTDETRRLLRSRAYLGEVVHGQLVNDRAHAPLATLDDWTAAQTEPESRRTNGDYVLSGVATCDVCGAGLTGQLQTSHGRQYRRYRCSAPGCKGGSSIGADALETYVRDRLRPWLDRKDFRIRFEITGLAEAEEAVDRAEDDRKRFASNIPLLTALGEAAADNAAVLTRAVDEAREHYRAVAARAARSRRLPLAAELDDDEQLLRALRGIDAVITVRRGRGTIAQRVGFIPIDDLDDRTGVLAA